MADVGADENINLDLRYGLQSSNYMAHDRARTNDTCENSRGTRFTLSRDELLTLPEFVLLSLFPNGLLPDGHVSSYPEEDIYPVDVRLGYCEDRSGLSNRPCAIKSMTQQVYNICLNFFATSRKLSRPDRHPRRGTTRMLHQTSRQEGRQRICYKIEQVL